MNFRTQRAIEYHSGPVLHGIRVYAPAEEDRGSLEDQVVADAAVAERQDTQQAPEMIEVAA